MESVLKERLSEESLQEAGLIKSAEMLRKKISLLRTGKVYSQQKYNLLREENEGFSKLVSPCPSNSRILAPENST